MVLSIEVNKLEKDELVDSNCAGDSFVGVFLAHLCTSGKQFSDIFEIDKDFIIEAIKAGNLMASLVVQKYGCEFPKVEKLTEIIKSVNFQFI